MALRVAGKKETKPPVKEKAQESAVPEAPPEMPALPEEVPALPEEMVEGEPALPTEDAAPAGLLDQATAGYKNPEQGPFMCANCVYFGVNGPNSCQFVEGPIHELGYCNIFKSANQEGESLPTEEVPPTAPEAELPALPVEPEPTSEKPPMV